MFTLIIRAIICYLLVLLVFRLMGKRQIGEMQPFELVLTLIIADLATIPMAESAIPTLHGIVPLITLVVVHFLLTFLSKKSKKVSQIISGKPVIIVNSNGIVYDAIEQLNITIEDLFEAIRGAGYFNLQEVEYAIMETNGTVNVLPKSEFAPVTNNDINNQTEPAALPITVVSEGQILTENLPLSRLTELKVLEIIRNRHISDISNVLVFTIDNNGFCYLQEKNKPFVTFNVTTKGDANE